MPIVADPQTGVTVETGPDLSARVLPWQGRAGKRGALRGPSYARSASEGALLDGLADARFEIAAIVEFEARPSRAKAAMTPATAAVTLDPGESAVVLVEGEGGVLAWSLEGSVTSAASTRRSTLPRTATFALQTAAPRPHAARRDIVGDAAGWLIGKVTRPVRAYVLKFIVGGLIDHAVSRIEGDMATGLVSLVGNDFRAWKPGGTPIPTFTPGRPARVLLMVHGTFSDTAGSFGQLTLTSEGLEFLRRARSRYDAILGFDHKTLAEDSRTNARALADALHAIALPRDTVVDAVAYSRGALVYRELAERIMPAERSDLAFGEAVFVGAANGGTNLANPEHWAAMVELYTNLAMAAARAAAMATGAGALSPLVTTTIRLLGRFVQSLSEVAITDMRVPGLASMRPDGDIVTELNSAATPRPQYRAITSDFEARLDLEKNGLTKELAQVLLDRVTDRLFQGQNDLVVDTPSMTAFGAPPIDPSQLFTFGSGEAVYHTIYFKQPETARQLQAWLCPVEAVDDTRSRKSTPSFHKWVVPDEPLVTRNSDEDAIKRVVVSGVQGYVIPSVEIESLGDDGDAHLGHGHNVGDTDGDGGRGGPGGGGQLGAEPPSPPRTKPKRRGRGGTRGEPRTMESGVPEAVTDDGDCWVAAQMDRAPPIQAPANLFVTISRSPVEAPIHEASGSARAATPVATGAEVTIRIVPLRNCTVVGKQELTIPMPAAGEEVVRFTVQAEEAGKAQVLVDVRSGTEGLASFTLEPVFVDATPEKLLNVQRAQPSSGGPQPTVLRIYEMHLPETRLRLRFDLENVDLGIAIFEDLDLPAGFNRQAYVEGVLREVEDIWASEGQEYDRVLARMVASAKTRADGLLPVNVRKALWKHRDSISAIQVISEEPLIPWELLWISDPDGGDGPDNRGFLAEWGLVRWLHNVPRPAPRLRLRPDRVHYVVPQYADSRLTLDGAQEEQQMLTQRFPTAQSVTADSLAVANFLKGGAAQCDLLHIASHGEADQMATMQAELVMQGRRRDDGSIAEDTLTMDMVRADLRFSLEEPRPLVFINACQTGRTGQGLRGVSGFADSFLKPRSNRGAGAFVGALWSVSDDLALTFSDTFYERLLAGDTLVEAVQEARNACKSERDFTWLAYSVFGNPFAKVETT